MSLTKGKVYIISGHYGSGKSEFAINFALNLKNGGKEVVLADLDIVNPYFRSREVTTLLTDRGIKVVGDTLNTTIGLDMPYISASIKGFIANSSADIILDCGGDDVGIRVLKQFYEDIIARDYCFYMVVNTFRPETMTAESIVAMKDKLEQESNLKVSGFVNNSNFIRSTTQEDMKVANDIIKDVVAITKIKVKYISGIKKIIEKLDDSFLGEKMVLTLYLRNNWL